MYVPHSFSFASLAAGVQFVANMPAGEGAEQRQEDACLQTKCVGFVLGLDQKECRRPTVATPDRVSTARRSMENGQRTGLWQMTAT